MISTRGRARLPRLGLTDMPLIPDLAETEWFSVGKMEKGCGSSLESQDPNGCHETHPECRYEVQFLSGGGVSPNHLKGALSSRGAGHRRPAPLNAVTHTRQGPSHPGLPPILLGLPIAWAPLSQRVEQPVRDFFMFDGEHHPSYHLDYAHHALLHRRHCLPHYPHDEAL